MPRDITVTFEDGSQTIYQGAPDNITPEQVTARATQEFGKGVKELDGGRGKYEGAKEAGRVIDKTVRKGVTSFPGFLGDLGLAGLRDMQEPIDPEAPLLMNLHKLPAAALRKLTGQKDTVIPGTKFGDVQHALETGVGVLPEVSQPQTEGGKAVANIAEPAVGMLASPSGAGTVGAKILGGLAAGAGGEGAARVLGDNALTRLGGSLFGGGLFQGLSALKPNAEEIVRKVTSGMNDLDWAKAEKMKKVLESYGISHLNSQLLGPRSVLDDVVNAASAHPAVKPKLENPVANVKSQSQAALDSFLTSKTPLPSNLGERREVLSDVQEAAQQVLDTIKRRGNDAFRDAMPPEGLQYDVEHVRGLRQQLLDLAKSDRFGKGTEGYAFIRRIANKLVTGGDEAMANAAPGTTMDQLDSLLEESVKAGKFQTSQHVINNIIKELNATAEKEGYKGLALSEVKRVMKEATPEFNAARAAKTESVNQELFPTSKGLTGDLARQGGGVKPDRVTARDNSLSIVFPANRPQPQAILQLEKDMGGDAVGQLFREHLTQQMNAAAGRSKGDGPASFVAAIADTNAQRQNINAAFEVTARASGLNPEEVSEARRGFYKLMQAFDSFKDLKLSGDVDRAALQQMAGKNMSSMVVAPGSRLGRTLWERATEKTFMQIADLVTSKDGLQKLREISQSQSPERVKQLAIGVLNSTLQAEGLPQNPGNMPE